MDSIKTIPSLCLILLILGSHVAGAQESELGLQAQAGLAHSQGWEPGWNGWSLLFRYIHPLDEQKHLTGGLELGYSGWGSQGLMALGFRMGGTHAFEAEILNGMAFYVGGPKYVFGSAVHYVYRKGNGRNALILSAGVRYSIQPYYRSIGPIYSYIDFPLRVQWAKNWKK